MHFSIRFSLIFMSFFQSCFLLCIYFVFFAFKLCGEFSIKQNIQKLNPIVLCNATEGQMMISYPKFFSLFCNSLKYRQKLFFNSFLPTPLSPVGTYTSQNQNFPKISQFLKKFGNFSAQNYQIRWFLC